MPLKDGTGPTGQGPGTPARRSPGAGGGRGRQPGGYGMGPGGECICPACNCRVPHKRAVPCYSMKCPKCDQPMTRAR